MSAVTFKEPLGYNQKTQYHSISMHSTLYNGRSKIAIFRNNAHGTGQATALRAHICTYSVDFAQAGATVAESRGVANGTCTQTSTVKQRHTSRIEEVQKNKRTDPVNLEMNVVICIIKRMSNLSHSQLHFTRRNAVFLHTTPCSVLGMCQYLHA